MPSSLLLGRYYHLLVAFTALILQDSRTNAFTPLKQLAKPTPARQHNANEHHMLKLVAANRRLYKSRAFPTSLSLSSDSKDALAAYQNRNNVRDQVVSAISGAGGIKVTAVTARNLLNDVMMMHTLSAVSSQALGRTMICSILLANGIPDEQTLQISYQTTGPIRGVLATCNGACHVRGYVGTPQVSSMSLLEAIGKESMLQVVKNHPKWKRPYNGFTKAVYCDVDRDVGIYLAESEQRSCALAAGILANDLLCSAAGGYLIEQLPGVTDEEKELVERNLAKLVSLDAGDALPTNLLSKGTSPVELIEIILEDLDMKPLQQMEPLFKCECSEERLVRSLRLLPLAEVEEILEKEDQIEARCEFCGTVYRMGPDEVRQQMEKQPSE